MQNNLIERIFEQKQNTDYEELIELVETLKEINKYNDRVGQYVSNFFELDVSKQSPEKNVIMFDYMV